MLTSCNLTNRPLKEKAGSIKGIVAFEITVTNLQAKYKLSQNRTDNEKKRIIESLAQSENSSEQELAEMMQSVYTEKTGTNET